MNINKLKIAEIIFVALIFGAAIFVIIHFALQEPDDDTLKTGRIVSIVLASIFTGLCIIYALCNVRMYLDYKRRLNFEKLPINNVTNNV